MGKVKIMLGAFGEAVNYTIASASDAGDVVTAIFGFISANIPFVLAILGPVVGWKFAKRLLNGATRICLISLNLPGISTKGDF